MILCERRGMSPFAGPSAQHVARALPSLAPARVRPVMMDERAAKVRRDDDHGATSGRSLITVQLYRTTSVDSRYERGLDLRFGPVADVAVGRCSRDHVLGA